MDTSRRALAAAGMGLASAPAYVFLAGLSPLQAAASSALATCGCLVAFLVRMPATGTGLASRQALAPPLDFVEEAKRNVALVRRCARSLREARACSLALKIADAASEGLEGLPGRGLDQSSRRVVSYYLPATVKLVEALLKIQDLREGRPDQVEKAVETLSKLELVFNRFADAANAPDAGQLRREMALLDQSLHLEVER